MDMIVICGAAIMTAGIVLGIVKVNYRGKPLSICVPPWK